MKTKRTLAALALFATLLLSGCGGSFEYSSGNAAAQQAMTMEEAPMPAAGNSGISPLEAAELRAEDADVIPAGVKLIYTADISMESTSFDTAVEKLEKLVADNRGWFEGSYLDNNAREYRHASYRIRIPAENFDRFCNSVGEDCKINSLNRGTEDVSENYYDTESRLDTQRTKLKRLQNLLAKAESMEDIITLESAISETELMIENLTGSLRKYDSLIDYSTISVTLREVSQVRTEVEPAIGFDARLDSALRAGSGGFIETMQDLAVGFALNWPFWVCFLVIFLVVLLIVLRARRKHKAAAKAAARAPQYAWQPQPAPMQSQPATPQPQPAPAQKEPVLLSGEKKADGTDTSQPDDGEKSGASKQK